MWAAHACVATGAHSERQRCVTMHCRRRHAEVRRLDVCGHQVQGEGGKEESGSEADGDAADGSDGGEEEAPASAEEVVLREMEALRAREVSDAKRTRKKRRELKKRAKIRLAQAAAVEGIGEEVDEGEEAMFRLDNVRGAKGLAAAGAVPAARIGCMPNHRVGHHAQLMWAWPPDACVVPAMQVASVSHWDVVVHHRGTFWYGMF